MWCVPSRRLISAVKHIRAELRIFQFSFLNSSQDKIMAGAMNSFISPRRYVSWKINFKMFKAWILESAELASLASFRRKVKVVFRSTVSSERFSTPFFLFHDLFALIMPGSARRIAMIVGGMPADLRKTVEWDSFEIRSRVLSNIIFGRCEKRGSTKSLPTKVSRLSAVISMAPLCLN